MVSQMKILMIAFCAIFILVGVRCAKRCQGQPSKPITSITETEWRLAETNNSQMKVSLSTTTFPIFSFKQNYEGEVFSVINNNRPDSPDILLQYQLDPDQQILRIGFKSPGQDDSQLQVIDYSYSINGYELELTEPNGQYYRMVPFTGVVSPDDNCTF